MQIMAETTVRDRFITQLNDVTIQRLLEEKVNDNPDMSVLAASDYALPSAERKPQPKVNQRTAAVYAVELAEANPASFPEISRVSNSEVRSQENCGANSTGGMQSPAVQPNRNVRITTRECCYINCSASD